jgi:hypothetical protein
MRNDEAAADSSDIKAVSAATYAAGWLRQHEVRLLQTNVIYARARKPRSQ